MAFAKPFLNMTRPTVKDGLASLGVFFVALPLSIGIAMASGVSAEAGLISAIIGGIVVGLLSGAPLVVSGPAAGLTALVLQYVQQFGFTGIAVIAVIAGALQVVLGMLRMGRLFTLIPHAVLHGMLAAIGFIIAVNQLYVLAGVAAPTGTLPTLAGLGSLLQQASTQQTIQIILSFGLIAMAIQLVWQKIPRLATFVPGAVPAVIGVTLLALNSDIPRVTLVGLGSSWDQHWQGLQSASWLNQLPQFLVAAIGLALVASAETLLTARAVDQLSAAVGRSSKSDLNQELLAQGVGNTLCGLCGGVPMTGVIVRSAANVQFGARTRWSTIFHGTWIWLFVGTLPFILTRIPLTALAAVLVLTGFKLLNLSGLRMMFRRDRAGAFVWILTLAAIVATDLLKGLAIGLTGSLSVFLWQMVREGNLTLPHLKGAISARLAQEGD